MIGYRLPWEMAPQEVQDAARHLVSVLAAQDQDWAGVQVTASLNRETREIHVTIDVQVS